MRGKRTAMRLAVLVAIGLLATAAPSGATVAATNVGPTALAAMTGGATTFGGATPDFLLMPPNAQLEVPTAFPVGVGDAALPPFPRLGSTYAVLTSGDARTADQPTGSSSTDDGATPNIVNRGDTAYDATIFRVPNFTVPPEMTCLSFDFRFLSAEYPDYITSEFNDAFIAELAQGAGNSLWTTSGAAIQGLDNNFAFDISGQPVTIKSTGPRSMSPSEAAGTPYGGATAPLRAQTPVVAGTQHTLYLSILDQSDGILDTAVFVDNLTFSTRPAAQCTPGALALGPAVAISSPSVGATVATSTPTLSGSSSSTGPVTVRIYAGPAAMGEPVQQLTASPAGSSWSVTTARLEDGEYTAQATQAGPDGINGVSSPATFTVDTTQIQNQQASLPAPAAQLGDRDGDGIPDNLDTNDGSRPPVPGKSVQVRVVSGDVFIKLPAGNGARATGPPKGFVPLKGAANIPIGSQLDTEDGRVALTSAADTGGAKVQTSDFYQGIFQVKQAVPKKKPKKPAALVTDLVLKGQLPRSQCAPLKGARAAAANKKKGPKSVLGQLWGSGKGKFRTSGKYSSATVRGTIWLVQDRCDGTLTTVTRGTVQVADFRRHTTVAVKAGHSYLARAQRAASKGAGRKK
jgi:hypothetical protein